MLNFCLRFCFCLLLLPLWGNSQSPLATMKRTEDPLVLTGKQLASLSHLPPGRLGMFRFREGSLTPLPFQIDERHPEGEFAYRSGKEASRDTDTTFDANDELVFMAGDLGDRAPAGISPAGSLRGLELEIRDPVTSDKGWAYLYSFPHSPPRSTLDYVQVKLIPEKNRKLFFSRTPEGEGFVIGAPLNTLCPDELRFLSPGGESSPDLLDRLKIRGRLVTHFLLRFDLKLDSLIKSELLGYTDGCVRVIYKGAGYFKLGFLEFPGQGVENVQAYRRSFNEQITFSLPFQFNTMLKEFPLQGRMDFNKYVLGYKMFCDTVPPGSLVLDGKQDSKEKKLDGEAPCHWIAGYGETGGLVFRMFFSGDDPEWKKIATTLSLNENTLQKAEPEDDPGELAIGINVENMASMETKGGTFNAIFYFYNHFQPGDEKMALAIRDTPLQVTVRSR